MYVASKKEVTFSYKLMKYELYIIKNTIQSINHDSGS